MYINPILNIDNKAQLREFVNALAYQLSSNSFQITLGDTTTSIIKNPKIYSDTKIVLIPRNALAMDLMNKYYIDEVNVGEFVMVHESKQNAVFDVVLIGVK